MAEDAQAAVWSCPLCLKRDCRENDHLFAPPHGDAVYAPRDKAFDYKPVTNTCQHGVSRRDVCQTCLGMEMAERRTKEKLRDVRERVGDGKFPKSKQPSVDVRELVHHMELDPNGVDAKAPGAKLDAGKAPVRRGLLEYFPRACLAVASLSADGAKKYSWGGWATVDGGVDRYGDAEVRHICKAAIEGPVDPDFKQLHATHEAWNAFARLELILRKNADQV